MTLPTRKKIQLTIDSVAATFRVLPSSVTASSWVFMFVPFIFTSGREWKSLHAPFLFQTRFKPWSGNQMPFDVRRPLSIRPSLCINTVSSIMYVPIAASCESAKKWPEVGKYDDSCLCSVGPHRKRYSNLYVVGGARIVVR